MANYNHLLSDTLEKKFSEDSEIIGTQEWSNFIEAVFDSNKGVWDVSVFASWR